MQVFLLQPPVEDFYDTNIRLQPIGLCSQKAAVEALLRDVSVTVRDYHGGWPRKMIALPRQLGFLRAYYPFPDKSPFGAFHHFYHFGAGYEEIAEDVAAGGPTVVGISSLFSPYYREVLDTAAAIKRRIAVPIVLGGSHASACPELMLGSPDVDYVIRGEGERPLVELLKCLRGGGDIHAVPNLGFKENGKLVFNEMADNYPLDELPAPDFSDLNSLNYLFEDKPLSFILTSRGCPYRCSFCSVHQTFGCYRRRKKESVLEEMRRRYAEGIRVFDFEDDNLAYDKEAFKALCLSLIAEFGGKDLRLTAMNGILYHHLDDELLELMWRAGFRALNLSLVSVDQELNARMRRRLSLNKYVEVAAKAFQTGFQVVSYQILGLPGDTVEQMVQTLVFSARLPVLLGASPFYLTPNSPISEHFPPPLERDIICARLTALGIETDDFSRDDIYTLFITTRIINFLKGFEFEGVSRSLEALLIEAGDEPLRVRLGKEILRKLLDEKKLYGWTNKCFHELPRFRYPLFEQVWTGLQTICTQQGRTVHSLEETLSKK